MVGPILVTYASRHGSTAGVAQAIGTVLAQRDLPVEVRAMETVLDLGRYRAVVAGSANSEWRLVARGVGVRSASSPRSRPAAVRGFPGDHRDWEAIRAWADSVAVAFSAAPR